MLMGEFISIVSCNGSLNTARPTNNNSMLEDSIQIFERCIVHQKRVTIMRSKMETLSEERLTDPYRAESHVVRLHRCGLRLSWQKLERSFLNCARSWIHDHSALALWGSASTLIGSTGSTGSLTVRPGAYLSKRTRYQRCVTGYERTWADIREVSDAALASYLWRAFRDATSFHHQQPPPLRRTSSGGSPWWK